MLRFDSNPILYWLPTYALCWAILWVYARPKIDRRVFFGLSILLLFLLRLPTIVFDYEINPDESQMITQALTLRHDPVYFRSVDGTTGGPLDSYFLILPSFLGLPFDFITAHLMAFALLAVSLWFLCRTARLWFGEEATRLALLPFIFMLGLTQNGDFLHYNSELVALVLLSWSYYLYATLLAQKQPSMWRIGLIGLLLGMVPFGKLQAVPLAAVVGLFVAIDVVTRQNMSISAKTTRIAILGICGLAFPCLVILLTRANGVYDDFVTFYIVGNFRYASNTNQWQSLINLPDFFKKGSEFDWLVKFVGLVWVAGLIGAVRSRGGWLANESWRSNGFVGTLLVATLFAITRTGSEYVHYLFFLTGPLLLGLAYGWQQLRVNERLGRWIGLGATAVFLALFGAQVIWKHSQGISMNPYSTAWQNGWAVQQSSVSKEVMKYARPGEKLVVWGWRCDYYVQTQMPQGVAENHTIRSGFDHPMQADYQKRYLNDFKRSFPPVFVDAVGNQNLWMTDRKTQGHEIIRPLGVFVTKHYKYVGLVNDTRIYVRNDRVRERLLINNSRN